MSDYVRVRRDLVATLERQTFQALRARVGEDGIEDRAPDLNLLNWIRPEGDTENPLFRKQLDRFDREHGWAFFCEGKTGTHKGIAILEQQNW